jgi:hypothetical protein
MFRMGPLQAPTSPCAALCLDQRSLTWLEGTYWGAVARKGPSFGLGVRRNGGCMPAAFVGDGETGPGGDWPERTSGFAYLPVPRDVALCGQGLAVEKPPERNCEEKQQQPLR